MEQDKQDKAANKDDVEEEEEEDFFNVTIQRSGCSAAHYNLQDCYYDKGDWRKCTQEMTTFRECMDKQRKEKSKNNRT